MGAITQSLGLFGATGELGRAFFDGLEEQPAFVGRLRLFASERSQEETRLFRDKPLAVEVADQADFDDLNEAVLAVPADIADELAGKLLAAGVRVWDATGHLRNHPQAVPLSQAAPDSLLIVLDDPMQQLLSWLLPLHAQSPLQQLDITVLAPVSLRGRAGIGELARQTGDLLNGRGIDTAVWPQQVAFNLLPAESSLDQAGHTPRERRLLQGLARALPGVPTRVRQIIVPVFYGAHLDVRWQQQDVLSRAAMLALFKQQPSVRVHDKPAAETQPSPVGEGVANDAVILSRLQLDGTRGHLNVMADPIRVGLVRPLLDSLLQQA